MNTVNSLNANITYGKFALRYMSTQADKKTAYY